MRLPAPFEVLTGLKEERNDAGKACTACMTHLQATSRMSAEPRCIRTEGPREYVEPSGTILWGGQAAPTRRPRSLSIRAGKKSYQLRAGGWALNVSSRRAADRSPTQHVGRRVESIGINSNMVGGNMQAIGTTPGRPIWLGCHGLTVGVAKRPDCLQENGQCGRPVGRTGVVQ